MMNVQTYNDLDILVNKVASPLESIAGSLQEIVSNLEDIVSNLEAIASNGATVNISNKIGGE